MNFALASDKVRADVVEATEFPELANRYAVRAVPKSVLNDKWELLGSVPVQKLLQAVLTAGGAAPDPAAPPQTA